MGKTFVRFRNLSLALCLGLAGGAVLAKGPGTQALSDQAAVEHECTSKQASSRTTAKSPQRTLSHSCTPAAFATAPLQAGDTAAKTPSRIDAPAR